MLTLKITDISNNNDVPQDLGKTRVSEIKNSRWQEIIKIRTEVNEIETKNKT